ncbi:hypothetical protein M3Y97_01121900 [Aphelenchoides bicaudatus]|nr:hypothetical protein M3Y97_01121900 [Aphelenchoides bicaudatus]
MKPFFLYIDDAATFLGILSNFVLIIAVKKRTAPSFKSYGTMVLVSALVDLFYAFIILTCHHHLQFVDGVMLINSYSLDPHLPLWPRLILGSLEHFCVLEAIIILPVQYYYRYFLMQRAGQQTDHVFYGLTFVTIICSLGMAALCIWSNLSAMTRGNDHYIKMLEPSIVYGKACGLFCERGRYERC